MPSGSKKRKAARKKKENQSVSNHSDGDDDVKQQDDTDSDVGELSSPNSHDHNSHQNNLLKEGDEEENEKGENISHTSEEAALKIKDSEDPSVVVEDGVVPVDREFEVEDKSSKEADGSSSGSSSSSSSRNSSRSNSDDESHRIKKGEAAIDITPVVELGSGHEKGENISHTSTEAALKIKDSEDPSVVVEDGVVPVDREFEVEDKSSKEADGSSSGSSSSSSSRNSSRSNPDDESHRIKKGEAAIDIAPVVELGSGHESLSRVLAEDIISAEIDDGVDSVVENFPAEELKNISTLDDKVETDTFIAPYILEPMESEEKRLGFVEDNDISTVFMDAPLKRKDESIENIVTPDPKECVTQESYDRVAADIGVELEKDSGVTEVLLPVPAPHPVQTTTWKSCCGLFEVFARSGR